MANLANAVAASSAVKFVASPISIIVRVNPIIFSLEIPNCPAASATAAISVVDAGTSLAMFLMAVPIASSSLPLRFVVLATPVKALSKSLDAFTLAANPAVIGTVKAAVKPLPIPFNIPGTLAPMLVVDLPNSCTLAWASFMPAIKPLAFAVSMAVTL